MKFKTIKKENNKTTVIQFTGEFKSITAYKHPTRKKIVLHNRGFAPELSFAQAKKYAKTILKMCKGH